MSLAYRNIEIIWKFFYHFTFSFANLKEFRLKMRVCCDFANSPADLFLGSRCLRMSQQLVLRRESRPEGWETDTSSALTLTLCVLSVTFPIKTPGRHKKSEPMNTKKGDDIGGDLIMMYRYKPSAECRDCSCCSVWLSHWKHWNPNCTTGATLLQKWVLTPTQSYSERIWTCWKRNQFACPCISANTLKTGKWVF